MISFRNFALRRGERLLLSEVDLTIHAGWRVGVVGRNGTGKSSLFAAVRHEIEADRGDVDVPQKLRIASVAQETPSLPDPAIDFVLGGDAQLSAVLKAEADAITREDWEAVADAHHRIEELNGYDAQARASKLLFGLGFSSDTHAQPVSAFSGGWRVRLNLARALMTPSDLLLLDEPTNHLDLDAVLWLEQWLLKYPGSLLLISHDREFLDDLCTHTLHLHEGKAKLYTGDYTSFERQRAEQLRQQQIAFEKEQVERAHLQAFIDRFKAKASKAKQAQSRMKRLAKLAGTEAVRAEREIRIDFPVPNKQPFSLITLRHAGCGYRSGVQTSQILDAVGLAIEAGDRIGLLGVNGAGKSTLVKTLVGELPLLDGERIGHPDLVIGYFAQHTVESLTAGASPIDHFRELSPDSPVQAFRDFLGRWNFAGDRAFESIDGFSGGERARLALALLAWRKPNVLLLDEPTNHLDLEMREALAEALADFDGAIVMVSHDRHLIGLVCDRYVRVSDGHVAPFDGDLDEYAAWLRARSNESAGKNDRSKKNKSADKPADKQIDKSEQSPVSKTSPPRDADKQLKKLEAEVEQLQQQIAALDSQLADPMIYSQRREQAEVLSAQQAQLRQTLVAREAQWLALYEQVGG